ncbi:hypothetical protein FALB51S_02268 [Frigidibacter albus]
MQAPYGTYTDTIHTICGPGPGRCEAAPLHEARQTSGRAGHRAEHPNGARLLPVQGQRAAPPRLGSGRQGRYRPLSRAAGSFESCRQPLSRPSGTVAYRAGACAPATWFGHLVRVAPAGRGAASGIRAMPGASAAGSAARRPHRGGCGVPQGVARDPLQRCRARGPLVLPRGQGIGPSAPAPISARRECPVARQCPCTRRAGHRAPPRGMRLNGRLPPRSRAGSGIPRAPHPRALRRCRGRHRAGERGRPSALPLPPSLQPSSIASVTSR